MHQSTRCTAGEKTSAATASSASFSPYDRRRQCQCQATVQQPAASAGDVEGAEGSRAGSRRSRTDWAAWEILYNQSPSLPS